MGRLYGRYGRQERCNRVFVGRPEGKRPLGRPWHRRIIIKWIFKEWDGGAWTGLMTQDRDRWWVLVNAVMNLRIPQNVGNLTS
jgi:hypothetical protein